MTYNDVIDLIQSAEHHWTMNNTNNDRIGSASMTNQAGGSFVAVPITTSGERTHSLQFDDDGQRRGTADQLDMNVSEQQRRSVGGGVEISGEIPPRPITIWKEGGGQANIACFLGYGGQIAGQLIENAPFFSMQGFGLSAALDRPYHWMVTFSGNTFNNRFRLFVDGVQVSTYLPTNQQPNNPTLFPHSVDIFWGDSDVTLAVGGRSVNFDGMINNNSVVRVADWASWFQQELTPTEVRTLFEAGARPFTVITSDTQANMQTQVDALGALPNYPLCLEVADVSGGGDLDLTFDGVTFDTLASLHIRWLGTGTLTLTLTNGSNPDFSKIHTPNGGSVIEDVSPLLEFTGLQPNTEVRAYVGTDPVTATEISGIENSGTSFSFNHSVAGQAGYIVIASIGFVNQQINLTYSSNDQSIPIQQQVDRNYSNP